MDQSTAEDIGPSEALRIIVAIRAMDPVGDDPTDPPYRGHQQCPGGSLVTQFLPGVLYLFSFYVSLCCVENHTPSLCLPLLFFLIPLPLLFLCFKLKILSSQHLLSILSPI